MGGISVELLKDYFGTNSGGIHPNIRRETHGRISGQNPRIISEVTVNYYTAIAEVFTSKRRENYRNFASNLARSNVFRVESRVSLPRTSVACVSHPDKRHIFHQEAFLFSVKEQTQLSSCVQ